MVNDHLSDLITRIRNGYSAGREGMAAPYTKAGERVAQALVRTGYLAEVQHKENELVLTLKYDGKEPAIRGIKRISKPGVRIYTGIKNLPRVWGGLGINILSTPKGVLPEREAKKLKVGGEIICQVW